MYPNLLNPSIFKAHIDTVKWIKLQLCIMIYLVSRFICPIVNAAKLIIYIQILYYTFNTNINV